MARLPRLTLPGYPHHIIQRGNNRQPIFVDDADRQRLLGDLAEHARNRRRGGARLCADEQPPSPARHARGGRQRAADDAGRGARLRALFQPPARAQRHAVGRALPQHADRGRAPSAGLHGLHRPESGARRHGGAAADYPWSSHGHLASGCGSTRWSRRIRCTGNSATRRLRASGLCRIWCARAWHPAQHERADAQAAHSGWALGGDGFHRRPAKAHRPPGSSRAARGRPVSVALLRRKTESNWRVPSACPSSAVSAIKFDMSPFNS
jgi:putative transposase